MTLSAHDPAVAEPVPREPVRRTLASRAVRVVGTAALAVAGVVWVLPKATGAAWSGIAAVLRDVRPTELVLLTVVWAAGLVAHSFVLTGALPGLTRRQALTLNLTGSAVANVAPMGGALGVAVNLMMVRAWRVRPSAFAAFTVVTNIWDVMGKLVLPIVALATVLASRGLSSQSLQVVALTTCVALGLLLVTIVLVLRSDRVAKAFGRACAVVLQRLAPRAKASRLDGFELEFHDTRARVVAVIVRTWPQLTGGMFGYLVLQCGLLWACLLVVGAAPPLSVVIAGFAVERIFTLAVITPGGAGLSEAASAGVLVALGVDPLTAAAGILLYRGFTFLLEIPVGGLWLGGWVVANARSVRQPA